MAGAMVLGMTVTAFAGGAIKTEIPNSADDGSGNFQISIVKDSAVLSDWDGLDVTKVASFDIVLSWTGTDEAWMGGALVTQSDSLGWNQFGQWTTGEDAAKEFDNVVSGKPIRVDMKDKPFAADDTYVMVTVQNYGDLELTIDGLAFYDEAGTLLKSVGNVGATDTPSGDSAATTALILAAVAALAVVATVSVKKFAAER